jgi:hypothetical protein
MQGKKTGALRGIALPTPSGNRKRLIWTGPGCAPTACGVSLRTLYRGGFRHAADLRI